MLWCNDNFCVFMFNDTYPFLPDLIIIQELTLSFCLTKINFIKIILVNILMQHYKDLLFIKKLCSSHFLNQARAGCRPARAWFLVITFVGYV